MLVALDDFLKRLHCTPRPHCTRSCTLDHLGLKIITCPYPSPVTTPQQIPSRIPGGPTRLEMGCATPSWSAPSSISDFVFSQDGEKRSIVMAKVSWFCMYSIGPLQAGSV